jgi:molecular chaperone GrpE
MKDNQQQKDSLKESSLKEPVEGPIVDPAEGLSEASKSAVDAANNEGLRPLDAGHENGTVIQLEREAQAAALEEWKSRAAYLAAEVDNMRKRFARERMDTIKMANESLIRNLLPVLDNLQFGLKAVQEGEAKLDSALKEHPVFVNMCKGFEMVFKHFEQSLEQVGVKPIKALGQNFDPSLHEAIGQSAQPDVADNQVTSEMQRGFMLHERVLRPAKVIVNKIQN